MAVRPETNDRKGTEMSSKKAQAAIFSALQRAGAFHDGELAITHPHERDTVVELVALMADAYVDEWRGAHGITYRSYRGTLSSGLRLDVVTDSELVAAIDLPIKQS